MPDYKHKYRYPLVDLKKEYEAVGEETLEAIKNVVENGDFILGDDVSRFEEEFARFCGVKHCIGVGSGTAALYIPLLSYGIGSGDEVIVPAFTFIACPRAVAMTGAIPVPAEVDYETGCIDPSLLEKAISKKTKAIMPVHLYGNLAEMDKIREIADRYQLVVIEDACEALGGSLSGRKTGSLGNTGSFSFYPSKNIGCYGDGGAITTNDSELNEKARSIRHYGNGGPAGINSRLASIQAAVLRKKLPYLEDWNEKRRLNAEIYKKHLQGLPVEFFKTPEDSVPVYYLFVMKTGKRDELINYLTSKGIEARIHFAPPIHLLESFAHLGYNKGSFPVAEKLASEVVSIPMHPFLSESEISEISCEIKRFFENQHSEP
ncbi:MAG: DegT/DnrJ/EryC1/StrS family aminotransferase [Firmicutes bacterium]|nr:DegT/DnrJ/EryC1/StrS family aminotransferase [Bacillota bacterium]